MKAGRQGSNPDSEYLINPEVVINLLDVIIILKIVNRKYNLSIKMPEYSQE